MSAATILLVDDEPAILRALQVALDAHDYATIAVTTGEQAVARAAEHRLDLIVLDLGLPGMGGLEVIRRVRAFLPTTAIVVLSAHGDDETKVAALDLGADDYVSKPFSMPELLARIRAALRHGERGAGLEATTIERGDIAIDLIQRAVRRRGVTVLLTRTQFDLLVCFARHPGRVLTHRMLIAEVWGDAGAVDAANLRVFVSQLRRRLEPSPGRSGPIVTEPGVGYRFVPQG